MNANRQDFGQQALQAVFSVFLGLIITAFVGVGVYTFMPNPGDASQERLTALYNEQSRIQGCETLSGCKAESQLTEAERAKLATINDEIRDVNQADAEASRHWAQRTSVILISVATVLMVISLVISGAAVLSNGVLLGGLFTMLYGVGWGIASGNSIARFLVLSAALAISLGLGYLRFVRGREEPGRLSAPAGAVPGLASAEVADLAARLDHIEGRLAAAGSALAGSLAAPSAPVDPSE
ncbi:MAG: hypothetical protein ACOYEV_11205 [Candidatus Nanopelagicales bacterium]